MTKLERIINVLKGAPETVTVVEKPKPVLFDLQKGMGIFQRTKGRYNDDQTKAVPFAILTTAEALGAIVTVHAECKEAIENTQTAIATKSNMMAEFEKECRGIIEDLLRQVKDKEVSIEIARNKMEEAVQRLQGYNDEVLATLNFFTV